MSATSASAAQLGQTMRNGNGSPGTVCQSWRGAHWWQVGQRASGTHATAQAPVRAAAFSGAATRPFALSAPLYFAFQAEAVAR
jgi:hypothetical protein